MGAGVTGVLAAGVAVTMVVLVTGAAGVADCDEQPTMVSVASVSPTSARVAQRPLRVVWTVMAVFPFGGRSAVWLVTERVGRGAWRILGVQNVQLAPGFATNPWMPYCGCFLGSMSSL